LRHAKLQCHKDKLAASWQYGTHIYVSKNNNKAGTSWSWALRADTEVHGHSLHLAELKGQQPDSMSSGRPTAKMNLTGFKYVDVCIHGWGRTTRAVPSRRPHRQVSEAAAGACMRKLASKTDFFSSMQVILKSHNRKWGHWVAGVWVAHCQCRWSSADEVQFWDKGSMLPSKY